MRILLAEDTPIGQRVTTLMLERLGHRADVVADGRAAVEALQRHHYDVVLMDVRMPGMDGLSATRLIRAMALAAQPYVIALTANALQDDLRACRAAGMDAHVGKPTRLADLAEALAGAARATAGAATAAVAPGPSPGLRALEARFEELASGDPDTDQALIEEIARDFLWSNERTMQRIREAVTSADIAVLAASAHELRGVAANLGLDDLSAASGDLEHATHAGKPDQISLLRRLETVYAQALLDLAALRSSLTADRPLEERPSRPQPSPERRQ